MHHHLEVVMPPVQDIEAAIKQIMAPFDEQPEPTVGEDEPPDTSYAFWDWYVIGGRWSGEKIEAALYKDQKEAFFNALTARNITVSGLQAGKQRLEPASQIVMVDALWNEFFPNAPTKVCPFFAHFNDQYTDSTGFPDVMSLKDMPKTLTASRVIIAGPTWDDDGTLQAHHMAQDDAYNGVNFVKTAWNGLVTSAITEHLARTKHYKPEVIAKRTPQDDWLVVTIDYHS